MEQRKLGQSGLAVSVLGFGCGNVGGLMTRGSSSDQDRAIGIALEHGINYFDTAAQYGSGASEQNLGRSLQAYRAQAIVGSKVKVPPVEPAQIGPVIEAALNESLKRLQRETLDVFTVHNAISTVPRIGCLLPEHVLDVVVPTLHRLAQAGKIRFFGMTALGDTEALTRLIEARVFTSAQVPLNLLNPSASHEVPEDYPAQNYDRLLVRMMEAHIGGIGIRVLAGGALVEAEPHPLARGFVDPMGTGSSFGADLERAQRFAALVADGHAASLAHAALRYAIANRALSTILVGVSDPEQLADAIAAAEAGPLSTAGLARAAQIQAGFAGEPR